MMAAVALTAATMLTPVSNERGWLHMPEAEEFRTQTIRKQDREQDWPFVAESGQLMCAFVLGRRAVYFVPEEEDPTETTDEDPAHADFMEDKEPTIILLEADPMGLMATMATGHGALKPVKGPEELLNRIAPFIDLGRKLCDQPQGSQIPGGEL
jgi:hypothetical protein